MPNPANNLLIDRRVANALAMLTKKTVRASDQEKARDALQKAAERIHESELENLLSEAFKRLSTFSDETRRLPGAEYLNFVRRFTTSGFSRSTEILFLRFMESFRGLDFFQVAASAPSSKGVESWVKFSGGAKVRKSLQDHVRDNADGTYETALCDWLLNKGGPDKSDPFLEKLLLRQTRPSFLTSWNHLLADLLKSDSKGDLLARILRLSAAKPELLESVSVVLRSRPELHAAVVDKLPALIRRIDSPGFADRVIRSFFKDIHLTGDLSRRQSCALLARIGAALLLEYSDVQDAADSLETIQELALTLKASAVCEDLKKNTWVFEHLGAESETGTGGAHVNRMGASHVAIAFSKAEEGYGSKDILLMLAHNLGMTQIGEINETASFDPLKHEDLQGGLLPGAAVKVTEPGWGLNNEVVVRAKVKKA